MYHFISQLFRHLQFQFAFIENFKQNCNYSCVCVCVKSKILENYCPHTNTCRMRPKSKQGLDDGDHDDDDDDDCSQ